MLADRYKGFDLDQLKANRSFLEETLRDAGAEIRGNSVKCWMHDDKHPSGSIYAGEKGPRFKCRPCNFDGSIIDVLAEVDQTTAAEVIRAIKSNGEKPKIVYPDLASLKADVGDVTDVYNYDNGLIVLRLRDKSFRQASKIEGGYIQQAPKGKHPLYNVGRVKDASLIVVVEGEKDVHSLHKYNIVAVTSAGGSKNAQGTNWLPLSGKAVVLWPDNDPAGRDYMEAVKGIIQAEAAISVIEPNDLDLADKEDASDFIAQLELLNTPKEQIRAELMKVIGNAQAVDYASILSQNTDDCINGKIKVIEWPFPSLNIYTKALKPGTVVLLCGNVGSCKSFMILQSALKWLNEGIKVSVFMLEGDLLFHLRRCQAQLEGQAGMTDENWIHDHPDEARQIDRRTADVTNRISRTLTECNTLFIEQKDVLQWVIDKAKAGSRVIVIDPITAVSHDGKIWESDKNLLNSLWQTAKQYGCSIILVTHPSKSGSVMPDISSLSGGASFGRACSCAIWIETIKPKESKVLTIMDTTEPFTHNRVIHLLKTRSGKGTGRKIACTFDGSLKLRDHGIIGD